MDEATDFYVETVLEEFAAAGEGAVAGEEGHEPAAQQDQDHREDDRDASLPRLLLGAGDVVEDGSGAAAHRANATFRSSRPASWPSGMQMTR